MKRIKKLLCLMLACFQLGCSVIPNKPVESPTYTNQDDANKTNEGNKQNGAESTPTAKRDNTESDVKSGFLIGSVVYYDDRKAIKPIENMYCWTKKTIYLYTDSLEGEYSNGDVVLVHYDGVICWEHVDGGFGIATGTIENCEIDLYDGDTVECTVIDYIMSRNTGEIADGARDSYVCRIDNDELSVYVKYDFESDGMVYDKDTKLLLTFDRSDMRIVSYEKITE